MPQRLSPAALEILAQVTAAAEDVRGCAAATAAGDGKPAGALSQQATVDVREAQK